MVTGIQRLACAGIILSIIGVSPALGIIWVPVQTSTQAVQGLDEEYSDTWDDNIVFLPDGWIAYEWTAGSEAAVTHASSRAFGRYGGIAKAESKLSYVGEQYSGNTAKSSVYVDTVYSVGSPTLSAGTMVPALIRVTVHGYLDIDDTSNNIPAAYSLVAEVSGNTRAWDGYHNEVPSTWGHAKVFHDSTLGEVGIDEGDWDGALHFNSSNGMYELSAQTTMPVNLVIGDTVEVYIDLATKCQYAPLYDPTHAGIFGVSALADFWRTAEQSFEFDSAAYPDLQITPAITIVPEPAAGLLVGFALAGLLRRGRGVIW